LLFLGHLADFSGTYEETAQIAVVKNNAGGLPSFILRSTDGRYARLTPVMADYGRLLWTLRGSVFGKPEVFASLLDESVAPWSSEAKTWAIEVPEGALAIKAAATTKSVAVRLGPLERSFKQKRLAICFFGINRSLKWTLKSIERNIFRVLENGGIGFDVFFHTYSLGMIRGNTYAQELNVAIKDAPFVEALAFRPHLRSYVVTDQKHFDATFNIPDKCFNSRRQGFNNVTTLNIMRELNSFREVTSLWEEEPGCAHDSGCAYSLVFYLRPDHQYHVPLSLSDLHLGPTSFLTPAYQSYDGLNDRLAAGPPQVMRVLGKRIGVLDAYLEARAFRMFFPELFLYDVMVKQHGFNPVPWRFRASRVRATGRINCADYWSSREGLGDDSVPECSPWHPRTPACPSRSQIDVTRSPAAVEWLKQTVLDIEGL